MFPFLLHLFLFIIYDLVISRAKLAVFIKKMIAIILKLY